MAPGQEVKMCPYVRTYSGVATDGVADGVGGRCLGAPNDNCGTYFIL